MTDGLKAKREAMDRAAWIANVKRVLKYTDQEANEAYDRIGFIVKMTDSFLKSNTQHNCKG